MKIAVASDHRGYAVKDAIVARLRELGHDPVDYGPDSADSVDYPDFAARVAADVGRGVVDRGVLLCGTGIGMCITANKFRGVRAAPVHDDLTAQMSRLHNDANIMCLSADLMSEKLLGRMLEIFVATEFEGGRHARRIEKIARLEAAGDPPAAAAAS